MSMFHDVQFPLPLAYGASGGPVRRTEIVTLANGFEHRNAAQQNSRRRYDAGVGVKSIDDMRLLIAFFEARYGSLYGFRFRDPVDHFADNNIGVGDGVMTQYQLYKSYTDAAGSWQRVITKPVAGSLVVSINNVATTAFTLDTISGILVFDDAPPNGAIIHSQFEFDVPVRFDTEQIVTSLAGKNAVSAIHVPLVEILDHA